jgi:hypothetical protein
VVPTAVTTAFLPDVPMAILAATEVVSWSREQVGEVGAPERRIRTP